MEINQIYLYRITHIDNIPHIIKYGITHRYSSNNNENFVPIGDNSLICFRNNKVIHFKDSSIVLGDFIPFYFGVRMPMLYVIQHGYNYTKRAKPENIIYIAVQLKKIIDNPQLQFFFTDGHSADFLTKFYGKEDINDIIKIIDWEAVKTRKWRGEGIDTDIKRRKQAEFLVNNDIPADYIHGYVCFNETVKKILQNYGIQEHLIKVFPQAYY